MEKNRVISTGSVETAGRLQESGSTTVLGCKHRNGIPGYQGLKRPILKNEAGGIPPQRIMGPSPGIHRKRAEHLHPAFNVFPGLILFRLQL